MATTASRGDASIPLQELEETVSRLSSHKGVLSVMILNRKGDILVESGSLVASKAPAASATGEEEQEDNAANTEHAMVTHKLFQSATQYLQSLQPEDEVTFLQLRSKNNQELMIAPHEGYVLAVLKRA